MLGIGLGLSDAAVRAARAAIVSPPAALDLSFQYGVLDPRVTFTRASVGTYFDSAGVMQTAAINAPRFDYDPVTLAARGLLIEEARTNLLLRSAEFGNAYWVKQATATVTANAALAPDGTTTADTLNLPAGSDRINPTGITATGGTAYTLSCWLAGSGTVNLTLNSSGGTFTTATVQVSLTGTLTRYSLTMTTHATNTGLFAVIGRYDGAGSAGTATAVTAWGAQLEAGAFPTSVILTQAATVPRAADVATVTIANGTYDVLVQDRAGAEWRDGAVVASGSYALTPRSGQLRLTRVRIYPAGAVSAPQKTIMAVAA